ncbi:hypothetical protein [Vibrio fortis]|uniref:hypothetical protein n=1 Tax=Vibrio fortis TaxID=212667 RepID=UPI001427CBC5|nr:hypothetical protein [Vibrio fortis]
MSITDVVTAGGVASAKIAGAIKLGASANSRVGKPWRMMGYFIRKMGESNVLAKAMLAAVESYHYQHNGEFYIGLAL